MRAVLLRDGLAWLDGMGRPEDAERAWCEAIAAGEDGDHRLAVYVAARRAARADREGARAILPEHLVDVRRFLGL